MPQRIAFYISLDGLWTGGLLYYENLLRALRAVISPTDYTLLALIPQRDPFYDPCLAYLDEVHYLSAPSLFDRATEKIFFRIPQLPRALFPFQSALSKEASRIKANVLFLKMDPGPNFRIPTLAWFPDFQYLHYPLMFSPTDTAALTNVIKSIAKHSSRVILSSQAVQQDFVQVVPESLHKTRILSFVSFVDESIYTQNPRQVCDDYHLPEKFFYLPNQIWKHKNHQLALSALTLARRKNPDVTIVSTGMFSDYRNPRYPSELLAEVSRSGNREHFIFLGLVPREHLYALMRQSLAVIQPSLFEGWSTVVEEVKSLGKTILLSDLPVHHEQNPPSAEYFKPTDATSLAEKMIFLHATCAPGPELELEQSARQNFASRLCQFGETFLKIVAETTR